MGVNNINSPVFATKATELSKSDTIDSTKFLDAAVIYVGTAGDLNVIVAGVKKPGQLVEVEILSGGNNYTTDTGLSVTGGHGSGATVDVTAVDGAVTAVTVDAKGADYQINDIIFIDDADGDAELKVTNVSDLPTSAEAVEFSGMQAGTTLKVFVDYVLATDTTAGGLVSLK